MSKPIPVQSNSGVGSGFDTQPMHSSIDLEAVSADSLSTQLGSELTHFESADLVLGRLRRRIGQLYGTTNHEQTLSRVGLVLMTLEACIARLNLGHQAINQTPSLMAIIHEIDKCCVMIENETNIKKDDRELLWSPLIKLLENDHRSDKKPQGSIEPLILALQQRIDQSTLAGKERLEGLADQMTSLRESQISENRKLFASLGALHATIERCVNRLSRVEYGLMEARSVEISSTIADWPQSLQSISLNSPDDHDPPLPSLDPRRALAAARGAPRERSADANS